VGNPTCLLQKEGYTHKNDWGLKIKGPTANQVLHNFAWKMAVKMVLMPVTNCISSLYTASLGAEVEIQVIITSNRTSLRKLYWF